MQPLHWHLFCKVIDNFGDIGVCWRLAKQLHQLHGQVITLWVDDLFSFKALCPEASAQDIQSQEGIIIRKWSDPITHSEAVIQADVVIEAFACELPQQVLAYMQAKNPQPLWLNLEYLSAENWVEGFHGSQSPVHGMSKVFFFPGFSERTGGLLWEPGLLQLSQKMQQEIARAKLFREFGLSANCASLPLHISLFAYENPQLPSLLEALSQYHTPVHLLVPQGRVSAGVEAWLAEPLTAGHTYLRKSLAISAVPFMAQSTYDRLLASCQLNLVRGEESFVRAQMLGLPMLWHIYQQEEDAHLIKLNAFLDCYTQKAPDALALLLRSAFRAWNMPELPAPDWTALLDAISPWSEHAKDWQKQQANHGDLASNLVHYTRNKV